MDRSAPSMTGAFDPSRSAADGTHVMSCADMTEALMTAYSTRLGLNVISEVVLSVLSERSRHGLPAGEGAQAECARRLDLLEARTAISPARIYTTFAGSVYSDDD